jgi:DNA replication protein DnaC
VQYLGVPRLGEELRTLHGSGGLRKWLLQLAKTDVLILDDWGTGSMTPSRAQTYWRSSTIAPA